MTVAAVESSMHVGKVTGHYAGHIHCKGVAPEVNLKEHIQL